jgi:hypothetical protein
MPEREPGQNGRQGAKKRAGDLQDGGTARAGAELGDSQAGTAWKRRRMLHEGNVERRTRNECTE